MTARITSPDKERGIKIGESRMVGRGLSPKAAFGTLEDLARRFPDMPLGEALEKMRQLQQAGRESELVHDPQ